MTAPQRHDQAVAFCIDRNFLTLALFMIRQIAFHNPFRRFDFVIASQDALELPQWAAGYGIRMHRITTLPDLPNSSRFRGSLSPYFRILLPMDLKADYRRILYLDADMFVEGGDFSRLLDQNLGPHPLAAVLDAPNLFRRNHYASEFQMLGLPKAPYANTGMMLIDTQAFVEQDIAGRAFAQVSEKISAVGLGDQSLLNLALHGKFAELAPCWNWQLSGRLPLMTLRYPVFLRHFIGAKKPHSSVNDERDARFHQAYAEFFSHYAPDQIATLAPPYDPTPLTLRQIFKMARRHFVSSALVKECIARFNGPYDVLI